MADTMTVVDEKTEDVSAKSKKPLVLVAAALVLVLAAALGWWLLSAGDDDAVAEDGDIVPVAQFTANLSGNGLHYARVAFSLVLPEDVEVADVENKFPLLLDAALTEVGQFDAAELRTVDGQERLRERLSANAADVYPELEHVRAVLTELLVQ